jgi:hypothetical protein
MPVNALAPNENFQITLHLLRACCSEHAQTWADDMHRCDITACVPALFRIPSGPLWGSKVCGLIHRVQTLVNMQCTAVAYTCFYHTSHLHGRVEAVPQRSHPLLGHANGLTALELWFRCVDNQNITISTPSE